MEKLKYRELVQKILMAHTERVLNGECSNRETALQTIFDVERDHYLVMVVGWHSGRRDYGSLIHVDIKDDKIWIQSDGTEVGVASELVEAGIPSHDIVLGYKSPFKRQFTDYGKG